MNELNDVCLSNSVLFDELYNHQVEFQLFLMNAVELNDALKPEFLYNKDKIKCLPLDDVEWFKYHCLAMLEEMGEVLQSDKRWKTHRNERYESKEKLDELSDVFITFCNIAIFSGFSSNDLTESIKNKIEKNQKRLEDKLEKKRDTNNE